VASPSAIRDKWPDYRLEPHYESLSWIALFLKVTAHVERCYCDQGVLRELQRRHGADVVVVHHAKIGR
jgi:hypothetical protein